MPLNEWRSTAASPAIERVLEEAGLLAHEKDGRSRLYRVNREKLALVREWLAWFEAPTAAK